MKRHPGLEFLEATPEFQFRYMQTVIARIFYAVNKSGSEKLTLSEMRKSNFPATCLQLDQEDDINKVNDFFSYEHFYVIYCKFWELDQDHDFYIDKADLARYVRHCRRCCAAARAPALSAHLRAQDGGALNSLILERIFSGAPRKLMSDRPRQMNYDDFVGQGLAARGSV